jgi:hypothetical protein
VNHLEVLAVGFLPGAVFGLLAGWAYRRWWVPFAFKRAFRKAVQKELESGPLHATLMHWDACPRCGNRDLEKSHCGDWGHWHINCPQCGNASLTPNSEVDKRTKP